MVVALSACCRGLWQFFAKLDLQRDEEDFYWGSLHEAVNAAQYEDCAEIRDKLDELQGQNLVYGVMKVGLNSQPRGMMRWYRFFSAQPPSRAVPVISAHLIAKRVRGLLLAGRAFPI